MRCSTIHAFFETARRLEGRTAYRHEASGGFVEVSWTTYATQVRETARGFLALGVQRGETIAIIGPNRPEWIIADLGALAAGAVPAPIYPTSTPAQIKYVLEHSEAVVAVVHDKSLLARLPQPLPRRLRAVVLMDGVGDGKELLDFTQLRAHGAAMDEAAVEERLEAIKPHDLATLIYTSGTTGPPKAVMLSHDNLLFTSEAAQKLVSSSEIDSLVCYLPLSHIAEQMLSIHGPAVSGASLWFCEQLERLGEVLKVARPTIFLGVPRVWEKMQSRIEEGIATASGLKLKLLRWAQEQARAHVRTGAVTLGYRLAHKLVLGKLHRRLGLDRARLCATGAAVITRGTIDFFDSLDLPLFDIYGQSESTGLCTSNVPGARRPGTVGRAVEGAEVKLAEDFEVLTRGRHVFLGYLKESAATAEALDGERYLHTGDVGVIDQEGYLQITDRKKDLLITSGGKNISPQNLEGLLGRVPGVSQAVVVGDARKYLAALITLDPETALREARTAGAGGKSLAELAVDPLFIAHLGRGIDRINATLAPYETIKKFRILPQQFGIESGELTPTMKLKRKVVGERYAAEIDELFH